MAKFLQGAQEKHRKAKSSDVQTIFDTEMEVIQIFHIYNSSREVMSKDLDQAIPETRANNNSPPPSK
jgi:hypothetical protein